eukprot:6658911-Pyramimonas_sp.AAC.1
MGPRRARASWGHVGHSYMGPRRAARGPRWTTARLRRACVWLRGSPKRQRDSLINREEVSGGSRDS